MKIWIAGGALGAVALAVVLFACGAPQRPDGGQGLLEVGKAAPALTGTDQGGVTRSIADAAGKFLVIYFYPKDGTPGCTDEACAFRDAWKRFEEAEVIVYGVSADDQASHAEFAEEYSIPFPLIADADQRWANAFGVGTFLGMTARVTFLVGPDGTVVARYPEVDPGVHATELLADVSRLRSM